jgi:predicted DNA-binding transcriptional regulator AlpA
MTAPEPKRMLTEKQLAEQLGVSVAWLQRARCYGYGPPFIKLREGGGVRYEQCSVDKWKDEQRCTPTNKR